MKISFGAFCAATAALAAVTLLPGAANAGIISINDKAGFLAASGATSATGAIPIAGASLASLTVGSVTFSQVAANSLNFSIDWTSRIAGNQFAINGLEDLDVDFGGDVFSFGFDFVEPENDPNVNAPFVDSTFEISLCDDGLCFETLQFSVANDIAAFIGVISALAFDQVLIREIIGDIENEFFGEFYTSTTPVSEIPLPLAAPLFLVGLAGLSSVARRRKRAKITD
ncbi:MAG: hypothetical protein GXP06_09110 [Alphaproteobacteria bacterium]|nr:hypothetical protein [Alphaproteobacteria bacterium]